MKKLFLGILVAGILISLGLYFWQSNNSHLQAKEISPQELAQLIDDEDNFFVYFYSPTCPNCIKAEPMVAKAVKITQAKIFKLNVSEYEGVTKDLNIPGTPTIFYYKGHKLESGITGVYSSYKEYADFFNKAEEK